MKNNCVFNFAASYSAGGYKRLHEYAKWFGANGGAWFVIHPRCASLMQELPGNRYFVAEQSRVRRLYDDCGYLRALARETGRPELYYAYGIPLYERFGVVNWFHLSNVLPLGASGVPLSLFDRLSVTYLGRQIRRGLPHADVVSAESNASLARLDVARPERLFLSVNGSDDELALLASGHQEPREEIATVVGTYRYKAVPDALRVFEMLRERNARLKFVVIGDPTHLPPSLRGRAEVEIRGVLKRPQVIDLLRRSRYYISTTLIENSYNAAAEGIFLAEESYISDLGPHRELLLGMPFEAVSVPGVDRALLHVKRADLSGANLKSWETVVLEMMARFRQALPAG